MFFDDSSTNFSSFDDNDFSMNEEMCAEHSESFDSSSPPPSFYSALPSSPIDDEDDFLIVEDPRRSIHTIACTPATAASPSTSSTPTPVVRSFSDPPKRGTWRDHMRDLHRATIDESIHRLSSAMRGGIEKKRRGKGGRVGGAGSRKHRPGCAQHIWSLVKHINETPHSSSCTCHSEVSGISDALYDRLRRLTRFDTRAVGHHPFTYSYRLDQYALDSSSFTLPSIPETPEESSLSGDSQSSSLYPIAAALLAGGGAAPAAASDPSDHHPADPTTSIYGPGPGPGLGRVSRSVSPEPSRPHCSSPTAPEMLQQLQLHTPVLSEEEMCARLSALPIGYHETTTVAALESALYSSLSLMDTEEAAN